MRYINKEKIIEAFIRKPNENTVESWDMTHSHGWGIILVVGYEGGLPIQVIIDMNHKIECEKKLESLGLTKL